MNTSAWMHRARWALRSCLWLLGLAPLAWADLNIPSTPLSLQLGAKPLVMLVASRDHRLFYTAYNDASDIDGDGTLDIRFKPAITYLGLFNPDYCYTHNNLADNKGLFTPAGRAAGGGRTCPGQWAGNWLNYVSTSRIDALRVVLYGGMRDTDTDSSTVLRRAYIPQDAHAWAKEYTSLAVDGYSISDYTPLAQPDAGKRHFFGSLTNTANTDCSILATCSGRPPLLAVVSNSVNRVWQWASSERPVLRNDAALHGGTLTYYTVRVATCTSGYTDNCKQYGNSYKPVGLLHDYGENDTMLFGLLTGSYDNSMAGGRLRKVVSSFSGEVNAATGQFNSVNGIVRTFNALRIRDFENGNSTNQYRGGWITTRPPLPGEFPDWGNPMGEMMYEALRYFAGRNAATTDFMGTTTLDSDVGLPQDTWDDPYDTVNSAARAPRCARANLLVLSDVNLSYDSDQVPGAYSTFAASGFTGDLSGFSASTELATVTSNEAGVTGMHFIGQSGSTFDAAPTAKTVQSLASIRGLAPEEPTKQGSYNAAAVAYFGRRSDLRPDLAGQQGVETFVVALASPLPRIVVPLGARQVTLVPFAKSVGGFGISNVKGNYQPTNQIVPLYVEQIANSGAADADATVNGGRYYAKFLINYEDVEQGADHEMDAIAEYTVSANADNTLTVGVEALYQSGSIQQRMGYIISGTTADGVYLEVQDEADQTAYFLNTPPGRAPGYCDATPLPTDCQRLPGLGGPVGRPTSTSRSFSAGASPAATLLKDPLWFAAKWGGFQDRNGNARPDLPVEWDSDGDGVPDNYLMVQNPTRLRLALRNTLDQIAARASSSSNVLSRGGAISSRSRIYQALYDGHRWSGDLLALPVSANGVGSVPAWQAQDMLPAWGDRRIFMRSAAGTTVRWTAWSDLAAADQTALTSADVFNYLRGDRSREVQNGGNLRTRDTPLGDMVDSSPAFDSATDTLYVGANDGMLHAFNATTGAERFAFVPRQSVARIAAQSSPGYSHQYLVDGDVLLAAPMEGTASKRLLFSLLGRGGKGLFALDVSTPVSFGTSHFLWEYSPAGNTDAAADTDLGLMLGRPLFVNLNNGKRALLVGNGYNSGSGAAVLYIFIVNNNGSLASVRKISTGVAGDNGLASPAGFDTDENGTLDTVYAGDLKGNVWKFDLSSADPANWGLALSGRALFQARDAALTPQPITAPMFVARNDRSGDPNFGKIFVFFGTGAYFRQGDPGLAQVQSWYGLIDPGNARIGNDRSVLKQRTLTATGTLGGLAVRTFSTGTANDMDRKQGWYIDLGVGAPRERMVGASRIENLGEPVLLASSIYPTDTTPCSAAGGGFLNAVLPFTGTAAQVGVFDINNNRNFLDDTLNNVVVGSVDLGVGLITDSALLASDRGSGSNSLLVVGGSGSAEGNGNGSGSGGAGSGGRSGGGTAASTTVRSPSTYQGRLAWREIVR